MERETIKKAILKFKLFYSLFDERLLSANEKHFTVTPVRDGFYISITYYSKYYAQYYKFTELL